MYVRTWQATGSDVPIVGQALPARQDVHAAAAPLAYVPAAHAVMVAVVEEGQPDPAGHAVQRHCPPVA